MTTSPTYRALAFALAVIFGVFNVGVPIVIASCPMMKAGSSLMCAPCYGESNLTTEQVTNSWDKSCCASVIAAERNTTEFVQSEITIPDFSKSLSSSIVTEVVAFSVLHSSYSIPYSVSPSPPPRDDIPVFNSSLLI